MENAKLGSGCFPGGEHFEKNDLPSRHLSFQEQQ
jgi:hypothetical protein